MRHHIHDKTAAARLSGGSTPVLSTANVPIILIMIPPETDVLVVGAGNAAFCAALAARERGGSVTVLERAPEEERGGNSRFTAGAFRFVHNGADDLREPMPDLTEQEIANSDFGTYTEEQFFDDLARVTEYRADPDLVELLVKRSGETLLWTRSKGIRFIPMWGRQAFKIDGRFKFWGGIVLESWGGRHHDLSLVHARYSLERWYDRLTPRPGFQEHVMIGLS